MGTRKKRKRLTEIAASASPSLRKKAAGLVLYDSIRGNRIDCAETLRKAAVLTAIESDDPDERSNAESVIEELGLRGSWRTFNLVRRLSDEVKGVIGSLAMVGSLVVHGGWRLLETSALLAAMQSEGTPEREDGLALLRRINPHGLHRAFYALKSAGFLDENDRPTLEELKGELWPSSKKKEPAKPPTEPKEARAEEPSPEEDKLEKEDLQCDHTSRMLSENDEFLLEWAQALVDEEGLTRPKELKNSDRGTFLALAQRNLLRAVNYAVEGRPPKPPLPGGLTAEELRAAKLSEWKVTEEQMFRLICVECFRLATAKPMIGQAYAPLVSLQGNLLRKLNGSRLHQLLFNKCWDKMVRAGAILTKKCGDVCSLNPHPIEVDDEPIRWAVKWAFKEHRRACNGVRGSPQDSASL